MPAVAVREARQRYGDPRPSEQRPFDCAQGRPAASDQQLSERTLVRLWAGQRFPASALVTQQGVPVRVLQPGRRGRGAGPDFRGALIATPSGGLLRGDVELHLRASDFQAHGHHRDRRYNSVVLHVVFEDDAAEETGLASGRRAPVVALAPWLRRRARELEGWLAAPRLWREPCRDAVARLGREEVLHRLEALGERRFREREASLAESLMACGPGEALYRALLDGLGYGGDRRLLGGVAELLPWSASGGLAALLASAGEEDQVVLAEALLLGAAGLLTSQQGIEPRHPHEARWEEIWRDCRPGAIRSQPPASGGPAGIASLRPANQPARRLAGLARLLVRHHPLLDGSAPPDGALEETPARLIAAWAVAAEGYWRQMLAPGVAARQPPGALIGRGRAIELLVNAVLPWAAARAEARGNREGAERARACFGRLPRPGSYGALASLEENLAEEGGPLPLDARRQQGLLALYKAECVRAACGRCPLS